jgi:hypothetical protein
MIVGILLFPFNLIFCIYIQFCIENNERILIMENKESAFKKYGTERQKLYFKKLNEKGFERTFILMNKSLKDKLKKEASKKSKSFYVYVNEVLEGILNK